MVLKMLSLWMGVDLMRTRIANHTLITIRVIAQAVIVITMGMILTVIGASIYGMFSAMH